MAALQQIQTALEGVPLTVQIAVGALVLAISYAFITADRPVAGFPIVRPVPPKGWARFLPDRFLFITQGRDVVLRGLKEQPGVFQVQTAVGYKLIVPNRFADDIKNNPNLSFNELFRRELFVHYPGMDGNREGTADGTFIQDVVRIKLTQSLGLVTDDLVDETNETLHDILGDSTEWKTVAMKNSALDIVARLSARVFLGIDLCRNKRWLQISKDYTVDTFVAARLLRMVPDFARPLVYWFIPTCTRLRSQVRDARAIIEPEIERRIKLQQEALARGEMPKKASDTIAWMVECTKERKPDYAAGQLSLTTAAIHTTSGATLNCMIALGRYPEIADALRKEIVEVLSTEGWSKVALYKLKLMDSFFKETQRAGHTAIASMNRYVKKPFSLSDGTLIPAGARLMVSDEKFMDAATYSEPEKFNVARFLEMREQPGEENRHQFVTTHPNLMSFGHGQHACPGRFFASNEMKILFCFFLLRYDVRMVPGQENKPTEMIFEGNKVALPIDMQIRRRREEIDLMAPKA